MVVFVWVVCLWQTIRLTLKNISLQYFVQSIWCFVAWKGFFLFHCSFVCFVHSKPNAFTISVELPTVFFCSFSCMCCCCIYFNLSLQPLYMNDITIGLHYPHQNHNEYHFDWLERWNSIHIEFCILWRCIISLDIS